MYIHGDRFKDAVDSEVSVLNSDLELLLSINEIAKQKATELVKASKKEIDQINSDIISRKRDTNLSDEEQRVHEDFFNHGFHTRYIITHSLFVSAYSAFETGFSQIANRLESYCTYDIKIKDLTKEKGEIDRQRKYIHLVHKIQSAAANNANWQKISIFQKLRNLIVHNSNTFKNDNSKVILINFLKNYDTHISRDHFFKSYDDKFLLDFKNILMKFTQEIAAEIYAIKTDN